MRSQVSERSLIIESSDEEDTHSAAAVATNGTSRGHDEEEQDAGSDSDSSSSSSSCATPRRGTSSSSHYAQQWPQSYRQSIDILSSVQSPNLSFLGTPTLSRLSNSFLAVTDSFRSKTPEIISNFVKPLLSPTTSDEQQQHEDIRKSSQYLLPSRKPSLQQIPEDHKPSVAGHVVSSYRNCSYTQGVMNDNPVCGIVSGGVIASILVVICLFWVGVVDDVGFENKGAVLNLPGIPIALGLYGYCYSVMGYKMFGEATESQFTLNLPDNSVVSKVAVWTTVANPITKYPWSTNYFFERAMSLEELLPPNQQKYLNIIMLRSALVVSTLLIALSVPFFGLVMALVGSLFAMLV
ncbi:hypothetical protein BAE44_0023236, partial [Dichanthelium oligosanthes]